MSRYTYPVALLLSITCATGALAQAEPLKIGVPTSQTGPYAALGEQVIRAIEFAAAEANAAGGVDGRKVEVKIGNDEGNPEVGRRAAEKLATEGHKILIGSISSAVGLALSTQLNRWDAIYVSVVNKTPKLTGDSCTPRTFRANHSDDMDIAIVAPWLAESETKKWAIIGADYVWGRGSGAAFKAAATKTGKSITTELYAPLGTADFAPYITQLRDSGAEGLWVALAGSEAINFAKQAKQFGLVDKMTVFGHNFVASSIIKAVGTDAVGFWGNVNYSASIKTPNNEKFVAAWRAKFNADPTEYEGEAYSGMQAIFEAAKKAKSAKASDIAKAFSGLTAETVYGPVTMRAADHQLEMPNYLGRVAEKDGKPVIQVVRSFDSKAATPPPSGECKM
ncbi:ABC transporter substrate-binding protein [Microvirga guangxiensis]|uniref:Amino acid/amide ABC transporter substrate-binding protein, HAAT family n=1 Tax=Microvirga guangxiensis TaxID=549386 RepID=A0A1G5F2L4_9HYPH|nr:ABC transporter substrate-binding protein [Microvirga guangxiensis]SCY33140.1 amino acid/amide ABC transporter substrate-binding protein, HAAT family [Microvirga guangxiensis]